MFNKNVDAVMNSNNYYREHHIGITATKAKEYYFNEDYETYFVEYIGDLPNEINEVDFAHLYITNRFFAILFVKKGMISEVLRRFPQIINLERSAPFTLLDLKESGQEPDMSIFNKTDTYLDGSGVVVAIIGTGIDYLNPRFMNEDNTTRIISIWDQSINGLNIPHEMIFGTEFTRENINEAIKISKNGGDPYSVVPHRDDVGYGTTIAGIVGAKNLTGMDNITSFAPNCEFIIVKLKSPKRSGIEFWGLEDYKESIYDSNDIVEAFRYVDEVQQRIRKPLVGYLAAGTNLGGHDGGAIAERYIDSITNERNLAFVTSTGNQGGSPIHYKGAFSQEDIRKQVNIRVDEEQKNLNFFLYVVATDKVSIGITSPTGENIEKIDINPVNGEEVSVSLGDSNVSIQYFTEKKGTINDKLDQRFDFFIRNTVKGIWTINIIGETLLNREFDVWLEQKEFLKGDTGFIGAIPNTTLMTPSTSRNIIVCASYNQIDKKILQESGRGFTRDGRIVPSVAVSSKNIKTIGKSNRPIVVSGTAVSGAILAGIVTLMYQWGVVLENDINIYYSKIKTYLISATLKSEEQVYPNIETGFGVLDIRKLCSIFQPPSLQCPRNKKGIQRNLNSINSGLFIRIPLEIYEELKK